MRQEGSHDQSARKHPTQSLKEIGSDGAIEHRDFDRLPEPGERAATA
jgi:hypothetical protein